MQDFSTWSKLYNFLPKLDNFDKHLAIILSRNLNFFRQLESNELIKVTIICVDTLSVFSNNDLSSCHASIQPMSQQKADAAGTDVTHVMLLHCIWHVHQIILWIYRRPTVVFPYQKINPISGNENLSSCSWEYRRQLTAEKWLLIFQGVVAIFYRQYKQKQK